MSKRTALAFANFLATDDRPLPQSAKNRASKSIKAKQNLLVASVNTALERQLITLECEPVARAIFEFNIGAYPVIAFVAGAGLDKVVLLVLVNPTELGRQTAGVLPSPLMEWWPAWWRFGEAMTFSWLERRRGKYLQSTVNYEGTKAITEYLSGLAITPLGFGTSRKEYKRMFGQGRQ